MKRDIPISPDIVDVYRLKTYEDFRKIYDQYEWCANMKDRINELKFEEGCDGSRQSNRTSKREA